jgi:hypothetical protein
MNDAAVRPSEFGTGLRASIERRRPLAERLPAPSSRDLVRLCAGEPAPPQARPAPQPLPRDLAVRLS